MVNKLGKRGAILEFILKLVLALLVGGLLFYIIRRAANDIFPK
jgi:hypothetical protein